LAKLPWTIARAASEIPSAAVVTTCTAGCKTAAIVFSALQENVIHLKLEVEEKSIF
tara:strand:- start:2692 stop:2859 length:168 start_codon:yes stop_codon:yes gene_type:complete